ncbi:S8 family peptidase [Thermococcus stetteri]|uniref:S8 family peptidase n=1 Tax=Thermococcus stetteri TaxID=49900 RepID=UPI001AE1874C|nr:S8 family serine peptidase [Thermococcus stetteri]MBP1912053.1 subtilisin family serine protease [Thermococcus stetteri]
MNRRVLSLLIVAVMLLSAIPAAVSVPAVTATPVQPTESPQQVAVEKPSNFIPGEVLQKEIQKVLESSGKTVRLIIAPEKDRAMEVYETLKRLGKIDPISKPELQFIVVEMPVSNVEKLAEIPGILHVWKDEMVKLQEPVSPEAGMDGVTPAVQDPKLPDMFMSVYKIHAYDTWINYGVLGDNVTVAVLDTGIDVGHPFLQVTLDGRPKIVDIYDASDEGIAQIYYATNVTENGTITVNMTVPVYWGFYAMYYGHEQITDYTMGTYYVGGINGSEYYLGLLPERYFDLNNLTSRPDDLMGDLNDVYPVLIVNQSGNFVAYIDFNLNNDFTDDQPIGLFTETGDYFQTPDTLVDIALAKVHIGDMSNPDNYLYTVPYGDGIGYAMFMWDAQGHGTHVSGTVAGVGLPTDPVFNGTYGVAPNAQLMEVKVLPGEFGFGATSWIINGMIYAASNGADVISMSLGGGGEINDGIESPENFYVNLLTDWFGVTFAIAAGNEGPTTNTVHAPGDSDLVITVGAFRSSLRWQIFYGVDGVADTVASFSSRGPRMDGLLDPDVIAPGEMIFSSLPLWYTVTNNDSYNYYGIWDGTSMATPHVSGAVALMISYAKQHNLTYDPIMIKRALELSAKPVNGTLIDQGFGLIQVDKAIEELEKLSQEPTTYIFAGTTYTSFKNPIEEPLIPISPAYVDSNGYFQNVFGFPYLYRGVYIRNEYPGSVPIYFYPMKYVEDYGLNYTTSEKTYKISTNVDWIIPNTNAVVAGNNTIGEFSINIDYSKLQKSGTYVGLVYIDDPDTSYIDGYIAVTVDIPVNFNGESHAALSDTALPGEAKHYFVKVPRGTKELRVTLRVPLDESGTPMGRTTLMIARPEGAVVAEYVPGYGFVGPGLPEYTWVIEDPEPGTWEITAYTSTFTKARTGYDTSQYEIEVSLASVSIEPELILNDVAQPSNVTVKATVSNNYGDFNATAIGYGVGRLDTAYAWVRNVSQDEWDVIGAFYQDEWDVIGAFYADPTTYFIRFGITQPEDPSADLDLYVYYFPTYDDLVNFTNYVEYTDQIGPTSDEVFEQFRPKSGYYLVMVHGYDTVGYNPIHYLFYYQILSDNGDVDMQTGSFLFKNGGTVDLKARVELESNGTYLGIVGLINNDTGEAMTYAPMIFQVGMPEMSIVVYPEATLGKPSKLIIKLIDLATMEPINVSATVIVNGREYHTDNGQVIVDYVPLHLVETLQIKATSPYYQDACTEVTVRAKEPVEKEVYSPTTLEPYVAVGVGEVTGVTTDKTTLTITANGLSGAEGYIFVTMPVDTRYIKITGDHVIDYYTIEGKNALYVVIKVRYGTAPITFRIEFVSLRQVMPGINFFYYSRFLKLNQTFTELYEKARELGVDNQTLQMALEYQKAAEQLYQEGLEAMNPNCETSGIFAFMKFRGAYISIRDAINILETAIQKLESESSEG